MAPDLSSQEAKQFRTRLRDAAAQPANFSGHYRMVTWGCGTECVMGAVIDKINGRVLFLPFSICCHADPDANFEPVEFRLSSQLVVFSGLRNEEGLDGAHFYEFDGDKFVFIKSIVPDERQNTETDQSEVPVLRVPSKEVRERSHPEWKVLKRDSREFREIQDSCSTLPAAQVSACWYQEREAYDWSVDQRTEFPKEKYPELSAKRVACWDVAKQGDLLRFTKFETCVKRQTFAAEPPRTKPAATEPTEFPQSTSNDRSSQLSVAMENVNGVYQVPIRINDTITLDAVLDSGASDVVVPADVVGTLIRSKTISASDFLGEQTYVLADGSEVPSQRFIIKSLKVGSKTLENVSASIASVKAQILLGQSFLGRFRSWSIDNTQHALILN